MFLPPATPFRRKKRKKTQKTRKQFNNFHLESSSIYADLTRYLKGPLIYQETIVINVRLAFPVLEEMSVTVNTDGFAVELISDDVAHLEGFLKMIPLDEAGNKTKRESHSSALPLSFQLTLNNTVVAYVDEETAHCILVQALKISHAPPLGKGQTDISLHSLVVHSADLIENGAFSFSFPSFFPSFLL